MQRKHKKQNKLTVEQLIKTLEDSSDTEMYVFDDDRYDAYYELLCIYENNTHHAHTNMILTLLKRYWTDYIDKVSVALGLDDIIHNNFLDTDVFDQVLDHYNQLKNSDFFQNNSAAINTSYLYRNIGKTHELSSQYSMNKRIEHLNEAIDNYKKAIDNYIKLTYTNIKVIDKYNAEDKEILKVKIEYLNDELCKLTSTGKTKSHLSHFLFTPENHKRKTLNETVNSSQTIQPGETSDQNKEQPLNKQRIINPIPGQRQAVHNQDRNKFAISYIVESDITPQYRGPK